MDRRRFAGMLAALLVAAGCGDPTTTAPGREGAVPPPPATSRVVPETPPASRVPPIRVIVREFSGAPVAGVRVVARPARDDDDLPRAIRQSPESRRDAKPAAAAVTDDGGKASLSPVPAGEWKVVLDAPGRVARGATCTLAVGGPEPTVEIRAETGVSLDGRVVTSRGAPVADAEVVATYPNVAVGVLRGWLPDSARVRTDADGRFRFDALPEAIVGLSCEPPGAWSLQGWPVRVGAVRTIDLVLDVRGPVEGVVRDAGTGNPVAGAVVRIEAESVRSALAEAVTDAQGRYRVPYFRGKRVAAVVVAAKGIWRVPKRNGAAIESLRVRDDGPTVLDLDVHADTPDLADVRGVVRGPDGPVAGASVRLVGRGDDFYETPVFTTDASGRFWFFDVPRRDLVLVAEAEGLHQPGVAELLALDGVVLDQQSPLVIASDAPRPVERDATLERGGDVVAALSKPPEPRVTVTGRIVRPPDAAAERAARVEFDGSWVLTDADGRFRFEFEVSYPREKDEFRAVVPGWGSKDVEFALPAGGGAVDAGEVAVEKGRTIRGRVACHGVPVAGAAIGVERSSERGGISNCFVGTPTPTILAVSAADGSFEVSELVAGTYTLSATARGHRDGECEADATNDDADATLALERETLLRGRVLRADDSPVAGARVSVADGDDEGVLTGGDGAFELVVAESVEFTIEVTPDWGRRGDFLEVRSGTLVAPCDPVEIRVSAGQSISGRVTGADGAPAAGVKVSCYPAGSRIRYEACEAETAADGTFTVTALPDGTFDVEVSQGLAPPVTVNGVEAGRRDVDVRLGSSASIEGVLVDAEGKPARGMTLVATRCADDGSDPRRAVEARTDASGRFRFAGIGAAPCRIEMRSTGAGRISLYSDTTSLVGGSNVSPGAADLVLRIPRKDEVTVAGRFVDDAGRPVVGAPAEIRVEALRSAGVRSDADGRFEVVGVRLDLPCEVTVWGAGIEWTLLVPAGTKDLVVTVGADGLHRVEIGGRVVEKAAARAHVDSATEEYRYFPVAHFVHATTGATIESKSLGNGFPVEDLPIGPWRVEVRESREGAWLPTRERTGEGDPRLVVAE